MKIFGSLSKIFRSRKTIIVSSVVCASLVLSGFGAKTTTASLSDSSTVGVTDKAEIWIVPSTTSSAPDFQSVIVNWTKAGTYTTYTLQYSTSATFASVTSLTVTALTKTIAGLADNTTYYFRVRPSTSPTGTWKTANTTTPAWTAKKVGIGWGNFSFASVGDLDQDPTLPGARDFVAAVSDTLWLYPGYNQGGVTSGRKSAIGTGFLNYIQFWGVGDWNLDGREDFMAQDVDGIVFLYTAKKPFNATAPFNARVQIGGTSLTSYYMTGLGDMTGDGKPDLGTWDDAGTMRIYPGNGTTGLGTPFVVGGGWAPYQQAYPIGDLNKDGKNDMIAINMTTGLAWFYAGTGASNNTAFKPAVTIPNMVFNSSNDWSYMGPGDMDADGYSDFEELTANGDMMFWSGADIATALGF